MLIAKPVEGEVTRPTDGSAEVAWRGAGLLTSPSTWPCRRGKLPRLLCWVAALTLASANASPDCVVTFNEINYSPSAGPEWVELVNEFSIPVDVGGWTLDGGMSYTIPDGTTLAPGAHLVVSQTAGNPAGSLGPFTGILNNAGDELRLHTRHGRLMDRVKYDNTGAWPALPAGMTLAKNSPITSSELAASWTASTQANGTPGALNFPAAAANSTVANRIAFTAGSFWKYAPTGQTPAAGWTSYGFAETGWTYGMGALGSASVAGSTAITSLPAAPSHYFRKAFVLPPGISTPQLILSGKLRGTATIYLDGVQVAQFPQQDGPFSKLINTPVLALGSHQLAVQTSPGSDTADGWDAALAIITPDAVSSTAGPTTSAIVINEILYHKRPQYRSETPAQAYVESAEEFIELHNAGSSEVDLAGWRLSDAVDYTFPAGTLLPAGGFLVVNQTQFSGTLSNAGERIRLRNAADVLVDEVSYADGGRWPEASDGGGVSLELKDPRADNSQPEAWAASIENAPWQTITYTLLGAEPPNTNNPDTWHEFLFGLLDAGDVLVDDVSVIEDPTGTPVQVIQNGSFESDTIGQVPARWRCLGTHNLSTVVADPTGPGKVLRILTTGEMEHTYNCCSTTLVGNRAISATKNYQISFRAKWLSGSPQLNSRLYLNRCARTTILAQPTTTGTPGAVNTQRLVNVGPTGHRLLHSPLIPTATQSVRVSVDLSDPDNISQTFVYYSVNGGSWQQAGLAGENGGRYSAVIPGQADGAVVQFYVQATDGLGATTFLPAGGPNSRALFRVGDGGGANQTVSTKVRCIMTATDANGLHDPLAAVSNFRWGCTVIDGEREVYYDAGVRLRSAPFGRQGTRAGWNISFPSQQPFRGTHGGIVIDGAFNMPKGDGTGWQENTIGPSVNEMLYQTIANRAGGMAATYDDICWFEAPIPTYNRLAQLKMARFNNGYLDSIFAGDDANGSLYKQELIYYPASTVDGNPESLKNGYSQVRDLDIKSLGSSMDSYRFTYLLQNHTDRDDFSRIINMATAFDSPAATLYDNSCAAIDTDNWMRVLAMNALMGLADTYNQGLAHNMMFYARPSDGRVLLMPWDQDHAFYYATNSSIFGFGTHRAAAIIALPQNRRLFCKHLQNFCNTGFRNEFLDPFISALSTTAQRPGYAYNFKTWVTNRRAYVLSQLSTQHPSVPFIITTNGGADFTVTTSSVTLTGNGWIDVDRIRLHATGETLPVIWTNASAWQITVPLKGGANLISLSALDMTGIAVGNDTITITNNGPEAASAANLVLSEINYHPADPDGNTLEFIELQNIGPRTVDCTGCKFTAGIDYSFPANYSIPSGGYALIVQNLAAFNTRYGGGLPIAGAWSALKKLSNGGDHITLEDRGAASVKDFSYDDTAPWPTSPDGLGNTLVLVSPATNPDHDLAASWRASTNVGGSPGTADPSAAPSNLPPLVLTELLITSPTVSFTSGTARITWEESATMDPAIKVIPEISYDLHHWEADPTQQVLTPLAAGTNSRIKSLELATDKTTVFFRLRFTR